MDYNKATIKAVTQAYISVVQDVSQGVLSAQILDIDCSKGDSNSCSDCIKYIEELSNKYSSNKIKISDSQKFCDSVCKCDISDINMSMAITLNFSAFLQNGAKDKFITEINNNMYLEANQTGNSFFGSTNKLSNTQKTSESLYTAMSDNTFQSVIQDLSTIQIAKFKGTGIHFINMNQTTNMVSTALLSNDTTNSLISNLSQQMIELSTQVTDAGLAELIMIIVQIIILVLILMLSLYFSNLAFTFLGLYADY